MMVERFEMPDRLDTRRLTLRPWHNGDAEPLAVLLCDVDAMRHMGGHCAPDRVWRWMTIMAGQWDLRGCGMYAVSAGSVFVGQVGLFWPWEWPELELAYGILPAHQNQGYAAEAARAVRNEAARRGRSRLVSFIHPDNHPSLRVAEKLGASRGDPFNLHGTPVITHRHDMTSIH